MYIVQTMDTASEWWKGDNVCTEYRQRMYTEPAINTNQQRGGT